MLSSQPINGSKDMKRLLLLLTLIAMISTTLQADPISREEARQRAMQFVQRGWRTVDGGNVTPARRRSIAETELREAEYADSSLYIFNIGENDGFVIVSGDDRIDPILGYADTGTFDEKELPENARAWLSLALPSPTGGDISSMVTPSSWRGQGEAIRPLLPTLWAQRSPYNLLCPGGYATGCVATAMAQVMRYYEWPREETTAIPAYSKYEELPPTKFDWDLMLSGYDGTEPEEQTMAVARLMQYCGWAVEMSYGSTSSAYERMIPVALRSYFGYDAGTRIVNRLDYTIAQWDSIIYTELAAGRPVIYSGQKSSGGHEFVCDGYDGNGFYHINWGWGGSSNGYFRLSVLTPPTTGTGGGSSKGGYNLYQTAVIGIQPDQGGSIAPSGELLLTSEELHVLAQTKVKRSSPTEKFELKLRNALGNHSSEQAKFRYGLGLMQADGKLSQTYSQGNTSFNPGAYVGRTGSTNYSFGARMTGTYRIVGICSPGSGTANWQPALGADRNYIEVTLTDTTLTLTEYPARGLVVNSVTFSPTIDGMMEVKVLVTNQGEEYNGKLCLCINGSEKQTVGTPIAAGGSDVITFLYTPREGEQKYQIGYSKDDTTWLAEGTEDYQAVSNQQHFNVWDRQGNASTVLLEGNRAVVPDSVVAADLRNVTPTAIVPNGNPNTLYYVAATYALEKIQGYGGETVRNVVLGTFAPSLTLTDGHDFFCPIPFTAGQATYTRTFIRGYDGEGGWDTIILPFDVDNVSVNVEGDSSLFPLPTSLKWFLSPDDTDKQFWLMEYSGSAPDDLAFTHATSFRANRPYLIAVPGPVYDNLSLTGVPVIFSADHAVVESTALTLEQRDVYTLVGTYATVVEPQHFQLNEQGSQFVRDSRPIQPFRAYMQPQGVLMNHEQ